MIGRNEICAVLDKMILSHSGWRGIFSGCGDEEGKSAQISQEHRYICAAAALVFFQRCKERGFIKPEILVGMDTRPTGGAIADAMIRALLPRGCKVSFTGVIAAPEIMAWAAGKDKTKVSGFIYISASHNPIGYNGIKFGLTDGGVLTADEMSRLIIDFRAYFEKEDCAKNIDDLLNMTDNEQLKKIYDNVSAAKSEAYRAYYDFCNTVAWNGDSKIPGVLKSSLLVNPLGIVCDFNGSARAVSADKEFFLELGLKFEYINEGQIAHRIVPEGDSLLPCAAFLEKLHSRDNAFILGYVPDCDGDRGNLVIWDDASGRAGILEAQEVFALACIAELSFLERTGLCKAAIAVNDPTSMRIEKIASAFGVEVFRAEVGEANVVALARNLREQGYVVRILGEGSAGGNIIHPSSVRDPVHTVLAIVKLLMIRSDSENEGLFETWCRKSGQTEKYRADFNLADVFASLPKYATTSVYSKDAVMNIKTKDHILLKNRYEEIFRREWDEQKAGLKSHYGFCSWEAVAYNKTEEKRGITCFGEAGNGGLKINFFDTMNRKAAFIWMRGSATEPVFRILADAENENIERFLIGWQRSMITEADNKNGE